MQGQAITQSGGSARWSLIFASVGHFYFHFFTAMYFTIVLALSDDWTLPYHELISLWTPGALLVGLVAVPAGKLSDAIGAPLTMLVFFIGMGAACIVCGVVDGPTALMIGLAGIGLFGAIYHPVGIPWVIQNAPKNTGKLLAINGVFGGMGAAAAGSFTGFLVDGFGWRAAFWIPGIVCVASGVHLALWMASGRVVRGEPLLAATHDQSRSDTVRVFAILLVSMFVAGVVYHGIQAAMPKLFTERMPDFVQGSVFRAGVLVTIVYVTAAIMQVGGGHLADKYPLKRIYVLCWFVQIGFLAALAGATGISAFVFAILLSTVSTGLLPAENMLLAKFTPSRHHGLAFGVKFVLAFGAAPLAMELIAIVHERTGDFFLLIAGMSVATALVFMMCLLLPPDRGPRPAPVPAE